MPIHESDPWREQYFQSVVCPLDVHIPTDDALAFELNPQHRWVYNKLWVAKSQGLECGPPVIAPPSYPVFSKPLINLNGMGIGSRVLCNEQDFRTYCRPGDFWMTRLTGEHVSTDWAIVNGLPRWCRHTLGIAGELGTFDYWIVEARARPRLETYCGDWIRRNLVGYTGMLNVETIGGQIIEVHLRFSDQWPDLYGPHCVDAIVKLYKDKDWAFCEAARKDGYSVALFAPHGRRFASPSAAQLAAYCATRGVSSVQITFLEDRPLDEHAMPPGGFRLAIINCFDLDIGLRLRANMARAFGLQARGINSTAVLTSASVEYSRPVPGSAALPANSRSVRSAAKVGSSA